MNHHRQYSVRSGKIPAVFCFALCFTLATVARADLILEQQSGDNTVTNHVIVKVQGDKMRMDQSNTRGGEFSVVLDMATHDSITLMPKLKMFLKRSGAEVRAQIEASKKNEATNDVNLLPAPCVDTGKTDKVAGSDTEIYTWSGAYGISKTLWVATNFPNYESIRKEIAKIDQFNITGPHRNVQPEMSRLPGMVLKTESIGGGKTNTIYTVSVKQEPVDPALFELPPDYTPWKSPTATPGGAVAPAGK